MESVKGGKRGESDPENLSREDFLEERKIQLSCSHINERRGEDKREFPTEKTISKDIHARNIKKWEENSDWE